MYGAWSFLKHMGEKKVGQWRNTVERIGKERVDKSLPLGIRLNGMLGFSEVDFILGGTDLKISHPGDNQAVMSYGKFPIGDSIVHRFYMNASGRIYMLQLVTDSSEIIEECKLFMSFDEVYPDDWGFWLSEVDGYIGLGMFQAKDGTQYSRVWQDEEAETVIQEDHEGNRLTRIPPVQYMETLYTEPYSLEVLTVKYDSMLYGRHINDQVDEYLLVSSVNEKEGASVQIMVGLELEPASITVI